MKLNMKTTALSLMLVAGLMIAAPAAGAQKFVDEFDTIEIEDGVGVGSGEVGEGHKAFRFTLEEDSAVSLEVVVTEVMQGTEYEDDDSILYVIDEDAELVAQDDDSGEGYASRIERQPLEAGTYYAVVVTYGNEIRTSAGSGDLVKGFEDTGESRFAFDLRVETEGYFAGALDALHETTDMGTVKDRAVASGTAGREHKAFSFSLDEPSTVRMEVVVTNIMQGTEYQDDDSILYLFNEEGRLLHKDDDGGEGYASELNVTLDEPGRYYAAVATYGDEPNLDSDDRLRGFQDTGKSRFAFDLEVETATHTPTGPAPEALRNVTDIGLVEKRDAAGGEAGIQHDAFVFRVSEPTQVDIEVVVTNIMQGTEYEDDDSILFLFDDQGRLIARDDDGGDNYASRIQTDLPYAGRYYAAVATYGDDVELSENDVLEGFDDDGRSRFEFQLVVDVQ